jgi:WD40 repeat protein
MYKYLDLYSPFSIAISPTENSRIASGWSSGKVEIWKDEGSSFIIDVMGKNEEGHSGMVETVAWRPDGKLIISGARDNKIIGWNADSEDEDTYCTVSFILVRNTQTVLSVAFSPDSQYIASGGIDEIVHVWNVSNNTPECFKLEDTQECVKLGGIFNREIYGTKRGHSGRVNSVAFSPDSKYIASGSRDRTIKIWEFNKRKKVGTTIRTLRGHLDEVKSVAFSPIHNNSPTDNNSPTNNNIVVSSSYKAAP